MVKTLQVGKHNLGKTSIQGEIIKAISEITGEDDIELNSSGRTDAGVHALRTSCKF